jgi:hypothetical protein
VSYVRLPHRRTFLAIPLLLAAAPSAGAQVVGGRVVERPGGRPIAGIAVRLVRAPAADTAEPADTTPVDSTVTARDGAFGFQPSGPGTYRVRIGGGGVGPPLTRAAADAVDEREYAVALDYGGVFVESQVDRPSASVPGTLMVRYPTPLQSADVTGCAALQFVVDTAGRAEPATFRVLAATHPAFASAAAAAVVGGRYRAGQRGGRAVRAVTRQSFAFEIQGGRKPDERACQAAAAGREDHALRITASRSSGIRRAW